MKKLNSRSKSDGWSCGWYQEAQQGEADQRYFVGWLEAVIK